MEFLSNEDGIDEKSLEITFLEDDDDFLGNSLDEELNNTIVLPKTKMYLPFITI
jgi:hypothetical protein